MNVSYLQGGCETTTQEGTKAARTTTRAKAPTAAQLHALLAEHRQAFTAYEQARLAITKGVSKTAERKLRTTMEANRPGFTIYWRTFNSPALRAERDRARAAKAAARTRASSRA